MCDIIVQYKISVRKFIISERSFSQVYFLIDDTRVARLINATKEYTSPITSFVIDITSSSIYIVHTGVRDSVT